MRTEILARAWKRVLRDPAAALKPLWQVLEDSGIVAGSSSASKPSPAPMTPLPTDVAEPDAGEEHDDDEPSQPDASSGYAEPPPEDDHAPPFSLTPVDAPLILAPYSHWLARPVPDPHSASLSELIDVLIEIVNAEGPVVCRRVYSLYNKAAGSRLGKQIVQVMNRAIYRAVKLGRLVQNDEQKRGGQINQVVRVAGSPAVNVGSGYPDYSKRFRPWKLPQYVKSSSKMSRILNKNSCFAHRLRSMASCGNPAGSQAALG